MLYKAIRGIYGPHESLRRTNESSILVLDVVLLLQLRQLLFSTRKIGFGCRSVLFSRHMIQHDDIALLEMEAIEVV